MTLAKSSTRSPRSPLLWLAMAVAIAAATPHGALAQAGGPAWTSLDGTPAGTPARVIFQAQQSSPTVSTFDILIHGFYVRPRVGPDGTAYSEIDVPGLERLSIQGAPVLPVLRAPLAVVTGAPQVTLVSMTPLSDLQSFGLHLWPQPVPAMDDAYGTPEVFTLDPAVYASPLPYPAQQGTASALYPALGSIPASRIECYPIRWVPATDRLLVFPLSRWTFSHDGPLMSFDAITRDRNRIANSLFTNWQTSQQFIPSNFLHYQGEYLFIYPSAYTSAIKPLVNQKKWRGFTVAQITTESLGGVTCGSVRTAIQNWYAATPSDHDHDCLLVGDINVIPFCPPPLYSDDFTDDLYGSVHHDSLTRDVFVGRLPVLSASDVSNEVKKIIDYEDHPPGPLYYGDVLLVAHKTDGANPYGDYPAQQESIRTQSFAVNPLFITYYGSQAGRNNAGLSAEINSGFGIVCYRGHGGPSDWNLWDLSGNCSGYPAGSGECYTSSQVAALTNSPLNSIIWSIACDNADLRDGSCIGREWMTRFPGGAVAHYGSTRESETQDNNTLEDRLYKAVWDSGITNLAHATTLAEDQTLLWDYGYAMPNAWKYTLFGDPDMNVRRDRSPIWYLVAPSFVQLSGSGQTSLDMQLSDVNGAPVAGALIGLWKPGTAAAEEERGAGGERPHGVPAEARTARSTTTLRSQSPGDEVADNAYTGADGSVHFTVGPQTTGYIYYAVRDSAGNSLTDSIAVTSTNDVPSAPSTRFELRAEPSVTRGATILRFGRALARAAIVHIFEAAGRPVATLDAPRGATSISWPGLDRDGAPVRSGVYFARLRGEDGEHVVRIIVRR